MRSESCFVIWVKDTCLWLSYKLLKKCFWHMLIMGLCVPANVFSEDAICIEHVAAQGHSLWVPGSTEVMDTQTTNKKALS